MATAYKCDRCGELYSSPDASLKIKNIGSGTYFDAICYGNKSRMSDKKDLCPNCARDFQIWWEHPDISAQYMLSKIESEMQQKE